MSGQAMPAASPAGAHRKLTEWRAAAWRVERIGQNSPQACRKLLIITPVVKKPTFIGPKQNAAELCMNTAISNEGEGALRFIRTNCRRPVLHPKRQEYRATLGEGLPFPLFGVPYVVL